MGSRTQLARWSGLGGIVYIVFVIVGLLVAKGTPSGSANPAEVSRLVLRQRSS